MTALVAVFFPAAAMPVASALIASAMLTACATAIATTGLRTTGALTTPGTGDSFLNHPHPLNGFRRTALRAPATALSRLSAFSPHIAYVRRRADLRAADPLRLPNWLRFPDPFNPAGDLHFPATLLGVSFRSAFFFDVGTLTGAAIFFTGRVARGHGPHPDQQGGRHSNYLV